MMVFVFILLEGCWCRIEGIIIGVFGVREGGISVGVEGEGEIGDG